MTEVATSSHAPHHRHKSSIAALDTGLLRQEAPAIEMIPNPTFSFPLKPLTPSVSNDTQQEGQDRRPMSLYMPTPDSATASHKRTASALPVFSFNASDTSGRQSDTPPQTPDETAMSSMTATRRGHKRGGSEFVGGDSRFGVSNAISSSPTKTENPPESAALAIPTRRSHAHRRSVAVSSHDLSQIMSASEVSPRLSTSLPSSPLEMPTLDPASSSTGDAADASPVRPPSRPRVEFVEQVEIIPRPLSTISSETESSVSTVRGHSVNNSINSVLSLGSAPATPRNRGASIGESPLSSIAEARRQPQRTSSEISKRVEREGEWLKSSATRSETSPLRRTISTDQTVQFAQGADRKRQKRQTLSHSLGFDRRRSEPSISAAASSSMSHYSALSLHDQAPAASVSPMDRRSSGQKLKQWALSKFHKKKDETANVYDSAAPRPESAESEDVPGKVSLAQSPVAETDLDAVFSGLDDDSISDTSFRHATSPTKLAFDVPRGLHDDSSAAIDLDDASPLVDLDAAAGSRSPSIGPQRRQLHSDRSRSSANAGNFLHRRAESEPVLMSFNYNRAAQKSMEDVFEEEEEDEANKTPRRLAGEAGMGITIVDADQSVFDSADPDVQRLRLASRESERPSTSYVNTSHRLSVPLLDRPASIVEDVIVEESSPIEPVGPVEVVEAHEEPRAASLEKSSDSSEASTLLAAPMLASSNVSEDMTPSTPHTSTFSSPDFHRRQGSFDASRAGTSTSSIADTRTTSSCATGDAHHDIHMSVDDVPSLTSSRSTMLSTSHANSSRRDISEPRIAGAIPRNLDPAQVAARRKNRASIQSLSQLVGLGKSKTHEDARPQTATMSAQPEPRRKDNRLKKLMFWRSKQSLRQAALADAEASV